MAPNKIKTIVRVRPSFPGDPWDDGISVDSPTEVAVVNPRETKSTFRFKFASAHGPSSTQEDIWERDVLPLVASVWGGMTVTVFAYGVTSSGKTHTIQGSDTDPGIIPRVVGSLFATKSATDRISLSYLEIYKDEVYDLLAGGTSAPKLPVREDRDGKVMVPNLTETIVSTSFHFTTAYTKANRLRSVGATNLNSKSSRSHAILTINVTRYLGDRTVRGSINLVDLAGSENNKLTGNDNERMLESSAINKSLSVLGQVVHDLNRGASRIPFRNSKLTRLLQDALGGSSLGLLICNIAPGRKFRTDTLNTLNFGSRAREVENTPVANVQLYQHVGHLPMRDEPPQSSYGEPSRSLPAPQPIQHSTIGSLPAIIEEAPTRPSRPPSRSGRPSSRQSLLPVLAPGIGRRPNAAEEREEWERQMRDEAEKEKRRLEAAFRAESAQLQLEKERELARQREAQLRTALDLEKQLAQELLMQKERELESERQMRVENEQREREEMLRRTKEEIDERISRAVEEEVKKRMESMHAATLGSSSTSGSDLHAPPAHDVDGELRQRLAALEQKLAEQGKGMDPDDDLTSHEKKEVAKAFLSIARPYLDKGDWKSALHFFHRARPYLPDNAKLASRIEELERKLEVKEQGVDVSPVKRSKNRYSVFNPEPAPEVEKDEFDFLMNRKAIQGLGRKGRANLKRNRNTEPLQEHESEGEYIAMDVVNDEDEDVKPPRKKRALSSKAAGKARVTHFDASDEENIAPDDVFTAAKSRRKTRRAMAGRA